MVPTATTLVNGLQLRVCSKEAKYNFVANLVKSLLYSKNLDTSSLRWGRVHEADARVAYQQHLQRSDCDLPVSPCGLVVDQETPCLACSPDGLVGICGLVEYKCPYKAAQQQLTPVQAATALKDFCSALNSDAPPSTVMLSK